MAILATDLDAAVLAGIAGRLRLSNHEARAAGWLHAGLAELGPAQDLAGRAWSEVQPWVADFRAPLLADLLRARAGCQQGDADVAAWFTAEVARPREEIDPAPLLSGNDLLATGVPPGPAVGEALATIRRMQLDGVITSREEALLAVLRPDA